MGHLIGRLDKNPLYLLGQGFEICLVENEDVIAQDMACLDQEGTELVQRVAVAEIQRIFLSVHRALLEPGIDLRRRHRGRRGTQKLPGLQVHLQLRGPDFQPSKLFETGELLFAGDVTRAAVHGPNQPESSGVADLFQELIAGFAVPHLLKMLKITVEIGKRIDASQLRVGLQCPDALDHRIYDPRLQPLDRHPPVPQGASGKNLDDDVALSFLLDQFGELDAGHVSRIPYGSDVGQSYRHRAGPQGGAPQKCEEKHTDNEQSLLHESQPPSE